MLKAWTNGDQPTLRRIVPVVCDELRRMARRFMRNEAADHTLKTTALVNKVHVRLVDARNVDWQHRARFFAIASQIMRRILVDAALDEFAKVAPRQGKRLPRC